MYVLVEVLAWLSREREVLLKAAKVAVAAVAAEVEEAKKRRIHKGRQKGADKQQMDDSTCVLLCGLCGCVRVCVCVEEGVWMSGRGSRVGGKKRSGSGGGGRRRDGNNIACGVCLMLCVHESIRACINE